MQPANEPDPTESACLICHEKIGSAPCVKACRDGSIIVGWNHYVCAEKEFFVQTSSPLPQPNGDLLRSLGASIGELVAEKNAAYGDSFAKCGDFLRLLYPSGIAPAQYDDALALARIFDKQMRIATRKDAFGESPYRDIAGYGILGVAKDQKTEKKT